MNSAKITLIGALAANVAIAVVKFIAAYVTGSSAMLSEGIHSLVDTMNEFLLLLGMKRSKLPPTKLHHFGHDREIYFWALIVSVLIFGVGGGMSIYEGITHLLHPGPLLDPFWNYVVLGLSFLFEGTSLLVGLLAFRRELGKGASIIKELRKSKDPGFFMVIYEDTAALIGLILAALGIALTHFTKNPVYDGLSSISIGLLLCGVAIIMMIESRHLILGVSASKEIENKVRVILEKENQLKAICSMKTSHLGPNNIVLVLKLKIVQDSSVDVMKLIKNLRDQIQNEIQDIKNVYFEPE